MTSWGYIGLGATTALIGLILFVTAGGVGNGLIFGPVEMIGLAGGGLLIVGGLMVQIGIIAEAVRVGINSARQARDLDRAVANR